MSKRALLVVDLQNEYLPSGKLPLEGIAGAVANAARIIDAARQQSITVIHIRHEAPTTEAPFFVPGSTGVDIIPDVRPLADEAVVVKNFPNSFRDTGLRQILDDGAITAVVLIGAMSHMCIAATARAAADFGYGTTVIPDACATRDLEFDGVHVPAAQVHAANMAALAFGYASLPTTDQWLDG